MPDTWFVTRQTDWIFRLLNIGTSIVSNSILVRCPSVTTSCAARTKPLRVFHRCSHGMRYSTGSGGSSESSQICVFCDFFVLLAHNFEFTETPRESFLAAYDCCVAHPTPAKHPYMERASISRAVVA